MRIVQLRTRLDSRRCHLGATTAVAIQKHGTDDWRDRDRDLVRMIGGLGISEDPLAIDHQSLGRGPPNTSGQSDAISKLGNTSLRSRVTMRTRNWATLMSEPRVQKLVQNLHRNWALRCCAPTAGAASSLSRSLQAPILLRHLLRPQYPRIKLPRNRA